MPDKADSTWSYFGFFLTCLVIWGLVILLHEVSIRYATR